MTQLFKTGDKVTDNQSNDKSKAIIISIDTMHERVMIKFESGGYGSRKYYEVTKIK